MIYNLYNLYDISILNCLSHIISILSHIRRLRKKNHTDLLVAAKIVKIMKNGKADAALGEDLTRKVIRDICNVWEFYQQLVRLLFLGDDYQSLICRKLSQCCKKFGDSSQ